MGKDEAEFEKLHKELTSIDEELERKHLESKEIYDIWDTDGEYPTLFETNNKIKDVIKKYKNGTLSVNKIYEPKSRLSSKAKSPKRKVVKKCKCK